MNPRPLLGVLILSAAFGLPSTITLSAASTADELVPMLDFQEVKIGAHRSLVSERLGEPPETMSPEVWIYWDYRDPTRPTNSHYKTLVLVFSGERLTHIRFTDTAATQAMLAQYRRDQAIVSLLLTSTSPLMVGPNVGPLTGEDEELREASEKSRAAIRMFLTALTKPTAKQSALRVRIAFLKENKVEHVWLTNLDLNGAKPTGIIASQPRRHDLRLHQRIEFNPSHLSDWMYVEDGKIVGGFTTRILRSRMTAGERAKLDAESPYHVE